MCVVGRSCLRRTSIVIRTYRSTLLGGVRPSVPQGRDGVTSALTSLGRCENARLPPKKYTHKYKYTSNTHQTKHNFGYHVSSSRSNSWFFCLGQEGPYVAFFRIGSRVVEPRSYANQGKHGERSRSIRTDSSMCGSPNGHVGRLPESHASSH